MKAFRLLVVMLFCSTALLAQQKPLQEALQLYEDFESEKAIETLSSIKPEQLSISDQILYWFVFDNIEGTKHSDQLYNSLSKEQFNQLNNQDKANLLTNIAANYLSDWDVKNAYDMAMKSQEFVTPLNQCKTIYDFKSGIPSNTYSVSTILTWAFIGLGLALGMFLAFYLFANEVRN